MAGPTDKLAHPKSRISRSAKNHILMLGVCVIAVGNILFTKLDRVQEYVVNQKAIVSLTPSCATELPSTNSFHQKPFHKQSPPQAEVGICSLLPKEGATASSLWNRHLEEILQASIHPLDKKKVHFDWTQQLLKLLTPTLLQEGFRAPPQPHDMKHILQKVHRKILNASEPALQIVVFGGSVVQGRGCDSLDAPELQLYLKDKEIPKGIAMNACGWPYRLQLVLDKFVGKGVVNVHNLAVGGTSTSIAKPNIDYWLYPGNSHLTTNRPDIIVNAFGTNDALPPWNKDKNVTGRVDFANDRYSFYMEFLRVTRTSSPCEKPPLVVIFDEYLGNQIDVIVGEGVRLEIVQELSDILGTSVISGAEVVRRFVLGNTDELVFSPPWTQKGKPKLEVHFGMAKHVADSWVVAYSMLQATLNYCEDQRLHYSPSRIASPAKQQHGLPSQEILKRIEREFPPIPSSLSDISSVWKTSDNTYAEKQTQFCSISGNQHALPCSFAFVAGPVGTARSAGELNGYIRPFKKSAGFPWEGEVSMSSGWGNKLGMVPSTKDVGPLTLWIPTDQTEIRFLRLHWLKSYGARWEGSRARFDIEVYRNNTKQHATFFEVDGIHNQTVSIQYPMTFDLGEEHKALPGSFVNLTISLVGGTYFKIHALMLCSR
jgi:hypothetical protein